MSGPFRGMRLARESRFLPHLLGTYELELHDVVRQIVAREFATHIHVGAAQGYYAIGCALLQPSLKVIAYEGNDHTREILRSAAKANGVLDRFDIRGWCSSQDLSATLTSHEGNTFLMLDVEGAELDILTPGALANAKNATILVETHDLFVPGCGAELRRRMSGAFEVESYSARTRVDTDIPAPFGKMIARLPIGLRRQIVKERTSVDQEWLLCRPRIKTA